MFSLICAWINAWVNKLSWGWWFETPSRSLWRQCNAPLTATTTDYAWSVRRTDGIWFGPTGNIFSMEMNRFAGSTLLMDHSFFYDCWKELPGRLPSCISPVCWWFYPRLRGNLLWCKITPIVCCVVHGHFEYVLLSCPWQRVWDNFRYQNDNATPHCRRTATTFPQQTLSQRIHPTPAASNPDVANWGL